jgi:MFS family permease
VTYLGYALAQVPGGMLVGRFGARSVLPVSGLLLAAGLVTFAQAHSYAGLLASRLLIGVATAPVLSGTLGVLLAVAGSGRLTILTGLQTGFGRAGVVVATVPFAALILAVGWRMSYLWVAALCVGTTAVAALVLALQAGHAAAGQGRPILLRDVVSLLRTPGFPAALLFQGVVSTISGVVLGLWGAPWLTARFDMDLAARSTALSAMALSWAISALPWGWLAGRARVSRLAILVCAAVTCGCLGLAAADLLPREGLLLWLVVIGLATGCYPAVLNDLRLGLPPDLLVHVVALLTMGTMLLVVVLQLLTGILIDAFPGSPGHRPPDAFAAMFGLLALALAVSAIAYALRGPRRPAP